jgi:predicted glycogen debranching enzyme
MTQAREPHFEFPAQSGVHRETQGATADLVDAAADTRAGETRASGEATQQDRRIVDHREWLVTDGLGGFASGAADGTRRRREHGLLVVADPARAAHWMLVPAVEAWLELEDERVPLSSHRYVPGVIHPDGAKRIVSFGAEPWPTWRYRVREDIEVSHEIMTTRSRAATFLSWRLTAPRSKAVRARLVVRPLLAARPVRALHRENGAFRFEADQRGDHIWRWTSYDGVPTIVVHANARYEHDPAWYRNFTFDDGAIEDLASPGAFSFSLGDAAAELLVSVPEHLTGYHAPGDLVTLVRAVRGAERARIAAYPSRLHHSADAFVVQREGRQTIVASYPAAVEDARTALAAVRGLCIHLGRLDEAEQVLLSWSSRVGALARGEGVPADALPEADAPLWYVIATQEFLLEAARRGHWLDDSVKTRLTDASEEVLDAYARGTSRSIRMSEDCLLSAGDPGRGLTWMGAGRVGKPVELQALWINALAAGAAWSERWGDIGEQATKTFGERFWNEERSCLFDVVDVDHISGTADARVRPNQLFALGGLPAMVITGERARRALETIERELWTPMGLRELAIGDDSARADESSPSESAVWPSFMAAFVDAWVRVRAAERSSGSGRVPVSLLRWLRGEARKKFLRGIASHLETHGVGFVSSAADVHGDEAFTPRGEAFDALALSEVLRAITD